MEKNIYEFKKLFIESMSTLRVKRNVKGELYDSEHRPRLQQPKIKIKKYLLFFIFLLTLNNNILDSGNIPKALKSLEMIPFYSGPALAVVCRVFFLSTSKQ